MEVGGNVFQRPGLYLKLLIQLSMNYCDGTETKAGSPVMYATEILITLKLGHQNIDCQMEMYLATQMN